MACRLMVIMDTAVCNRRPAAASGSMSKLGAGSGGLRLDPERIELDPSFFKASPEVRGIIEVEQ